MACTASWCHCDIHTRAAAEDHVWVMILLELGSVLKSKAVLLHKKSWVGPGTLVLLVSMEDHSVTRLILIGVACTSPQSQNVVQAQAAAEDHV